MIALGLHRDVSSVAYHNDPGVSNGKLASMAKSPAHCYALHVDPNRPEQVPTDAMMLGTLAHCVMLEPAEVDKRFAIKPTGMSFATKDGKAWRDAVPSSQTIVSQADADRAWAMHTALHAVPVLSKLLSTGHPETSAFWLDKSTGLRCRARPDWLQMTGTHRGTVVDLKTIVDLTPDAVSRAIASRGYHRQAAHYRRGVQACGIEVEEFVFAFVSSTYPHVAVAYVLDDETREQAEDEVDELLERFASCQRMNLWPAYGDGYQLIGLPKWARRSNDVEVNYVEETEDV